MRGGFSCFKVNDKLKKGKYLLFINKNILKNKK
jgi:hypothetical protein